MPDDLELFDLDLVENLFPSEPSPVLAPNEQKLVSIYREMNSIRWENKNSPERIKAAHARLDALRAEVTALETALTTHATTDSGEEIEVSPLSLDALSRVPKHYRLRDGWFRDGGDYVYAVCCTSETCNCLSHPAIRVLERKGVMR